MTVMPTLRTSMGPAMSDGASPGGSAGVGSRSRSTVAF
jgi:hypothetical protein